MNAWNTIALLTSLAAAAGVRAESAAEGVLTRAPVVVEPAAPEYPAQAKVQGISAEVVLELDVSAEGHVLDARAVEPAGNGFDEAALAAARRLRFSPAEIDGKPSAVTIGYRFLFVAPPPEPPAPPSTSDDYGVVVIGQREKKEVTSVTITAGEVARIAGVSGDTVKVVQNLPGVARAPGGLGLLVVRGGNPEDTRTYVDGVEVPLVFHFGGLTSVIPSDLVEAVDFEAGNFGVRHGRATGGRIDLRTRDPNTERLHLVTDANLYHALVMAEGPLSETLSVAVGVRRSYADGVVRAAARSSDDFGVTVAPRYYDLQGKLAWRPTPDDTVRLSFLGSDDHMVFSDVKTDELEDLHRLEIGTAFWQATASWDHRFSEVARARLAVAQGHVAETNQIGSVGSVRNRIPVTSVRAEGTRDLADSLALSAGVDARIVPSSSIAIEFPEIPPPNQLPNPDDRRVRLHMNLRAWEAGIWTEATWKPVEGLVVVPGIRLEREEFLNGMSWIDPRLAVRWTVAEETTLKGGLGLYHQPPQAVFLTKEWGNPDLHQEGAWHSMVGLEQRIHGPLTLDLQLYYKDLFDLVLPTSELVVRDGTRVPLRYTNGGTGSAYGAELLLRWAPGGRFFGWVAYSLSRSVRDQDVIGGQLDSRGDELDQPHNLVALGTVELPELWNGLSAGFRVRYATGNPYRPTVGAVYDGDSDTYRPVADASRTERTPDFFQLDLRADKRWTYRSWILSAYLEVQNATNRKNPEGAAHNSDYSREGWTTGLPLFPSFGIRAEY